MRYNINGVIGEIEGFPSCHQIAISHSVFLPKSSRGFGKGSEANLKRQKLVFNELGYDLMLATVCDDNFAQISVMEKNGWERLTGFINSKTDNKISLWACKKVYDYEKIHSS